MAFITPPGGMAILGLTAFKPNDLASGRTLVTGTGTGSRLAIVIRVPKSGTLSGVRIPLATCTAPQDVRVAFQNLAATTAFPDNTEDQFRDEPASKWVTNTIMESGLITSDGTDSGSLRTVTAGEALAITLRWVSATGTSIQPWIRNGNTAPQSYGSLGYNTRWGASNWFGSDLGFGGVELVYSDGTREVPGWMRIQHNITLNTHQLSWSPDEYALKFTARFGGKIGMLGAWWANTSTSANVEWSIYDEASTVLARVSQANVFKNGGRVPTFQRFLPAITIARDSTYRVSCRPSGANNIDILTTRIDATEQAGHPFGASGCLSTRTNDGAWTDDATKMPFYLIGFSQLEN